MRRTFSASLITALVFLIASSSDAGATVTFSLIWSGTSGSGSGIGTNAINAAPGDTLYLDLVLTHDEVNGIGGHSFSISFDTDLANELNLVSASKWAGITYGSTSMSSTYSPISPNAPTYVESTGAVPGRINLIESGTLDAGLPAGSYVVGTAVFVVTGNVATDGDDLATFINPMFDGVLDGVTSELLPLSSINFQTAQVNVPEPGSASLLGLGVVALLLTRRWIRRS